MPARVVLRRLSGALGAPGAGAQQADQHGHVLGRPLAAAGEDRRAQRWRPAQDLADPPLGQRRIQLELMAHELSYGTGLEGRLIGHWTDRSLPPPIGGDEGDPRLTLLHRPVQFSCNGKSLKLLT